MHAIFVLEETVKKAAKYTKPPKVAVLKTKTRGMIQILKNCLANQNRKETRGEGLVFKELWHTTAKSEDPLFLPVSRDQLC